MTADIVAFPSDEVKALNALFASRKLLSGCPSYSDLWRELSKDAERAWQQLVEVCGSSAAAEAAVARVARSASA